MTAGRVVAALAALAVAGFVAVMALFAALFMGGDASQLAGAAQGPGAGVFGAMSVTVDPAVVANIAAVTGIPAKAVEGLALIAPRVKTETGCDMGWWLLAGVSLVESGHGTTTVNGVQASIGADWVARPLIGGLILDGAGVAAIADGLGGYDRAQGPMQFIAISWATYGRDGNGDGVNDPHNYLDALLAAAVHLCDSARRAGMSSDLRVEVNAAAGIYGYNHSAAYVAQVWEAASRYRLQAGDVIPVRVAARTVGVSADGQRIAAAALAWAGRVYTVQREQCMFFVRAVLAEVGVDPGVTTRTVDGYWTGVGIANSIGADQGDIIRDSALLLPGDIVMFADTYGDWGPDAVTHVGISVGGGMIVDQSTAGAPVNHRPLSTFSPPARGRFVAGVRLRTGG